MTVRRAMVGMVVVGSISACATAADIRAKSPFMEATSAKSVNEIGACVADRWSSQSRPVNTMPRRNGLAMTMSDNFFGNPFIIIAIDIDDSGSERSVKVYTDRGAGSNTLRSEIASCI